MDRALDDPNDQPTPSPLPPPAGVPNVGIVFADNAARARLQALQDRREVSAERGLSADWTAPEADPSFVEIKRNALRTVYRLTKGGEVLFVKLHRRPGGLMQLKQLLVGDPARREMRISEYARRHGVPAVEVLAAARRADGGSVSVSAAIEPAASLAEAFSALMFRATCGGEPESCGTPHMVAPRDSAARRKALAALTMSVAQLFARAHEVGFLHPDAHPGNVLVRPDDAGGFTCFFVDLYGTRCGQPVSVAEAADNLAALHQWFAARAGGAQRLRFLKAYACARRRWRSREALHAFARQILHASVRRSRALYAKRDRRIGRDNAHFATASVGNLRGRFTLRFRNLPETLGLVEHVTAEGSTPVSTTVLNSTGHRAGVRVRRTGARIRDDWENWLTERAGRADVWRDDPHAESFSAPSWRYGLLWRCGLSPAWRRYRTACLLMNRDLPVAVPEAYVVALSRMACSTVGWWRSTPPGGQVLSSWLAEATAGERAVTCTVVGRLLADTCRRGVALDNISATRIEVARGLAGPGCASAATDDDAGEDGCQTDEAGGGETLGVGHGWRVYWSGVEGVALYRPCPRHVRHWMLARLRESLIASVAYRPEDWHGILAAYVRCYGPAEEPADAVTLDRRLPGDDDATT